MLGSVSTWCHVEFEPMPLFTWGKMPEGDQLAEAPAEEHSTPVKALGRIWHASWGLRLGLAVIAVLIWAGATSLPSSPPATGASVSPQVTPVVAPSGQSTPSPSVDTAPPTPNLPQQPLDIQYDYGPGPQPVPGVTP
jgi:hypothetical protein